MCCYNPNTSLVKIVIKTIMDADLRQRFLADPMRTAQEFGFSESEWHELAKYEPRKLRAIVEGPRSRY